ncbi:MAG: zeta toxin family protein [Verrucomicrobiaceae bacterium]|nr:zeta toxin family protein [Verrucomicrobiaceae bacterium]
MKPALYILGGCNGAGKSTLARRLLPMLGIHRFLNADEIAKGLSPVDPSLAAFKAGRLLIEEARELIAAGSSFAIESTLSGRTYLSMIREAKERGFRFVLHYILIESGSQAVNRVALRVTHGGHHVPEEDVRRRFDRSRKHFVEDYVPLADDTSHRIEDLHDLMNTNRLMEQPVITDTKEMVRLGLEASRLVTEEMLDFYRRMDIKVTPQMTLAEPETQQKPLIYR